MFEFIQSTFTKLFLDERILVGVFFIGLFTGVMSWTHNVFLKPLGTSLNAIGNILYVLFMSLLLVFHILTLTVAMIVVLSGFFLILAVAIYIGQFVIPEILSGHYFSITEIVMMSVAVLLVVFMTIKLHENVNSLFRRFFKRAVDPVRDCKEYLKSGCSHVDGMNCNKTCQFHPDHVEDKSIEP